MPALLITASSRPNVLVAASTIAAAPSGVSTESCAATAVPPALRISSTTASATDASAPTPFIELPMSLTTTWAPRRARSRA